MKCAVSVKYTLKSKDLVKEKEKKKERKKRRKNISKNFILIDFILK